MSALFIDDDIAPKSTNTGTPFDAFYAEHRAKWQPWWIFYAWIKDKPLVSTSCVEYECWIMEQWRKVKRKSELAYTYDDKIELTNTLIRMVTNG